MNVRHTLLIFIPAVLLVSLTLFISVVQYKPLHEQIQETQPSSSEELVIPILPEDPILGDKKSPISIIMFADLGCESCKKQHAIISELQQTYPKKIKVIWKGLPVTRFPVSSEEAHAYAYCANRQGKIESFITLLYAQTSPLTETILTAAAEEIGLQQDILQECLASTAPQQYKDTVTGLANILQIQSVPTLFLEGKQIKPPTSREAWEALLSASL